jgi:hypothetical protein
MIDMPPHLPQSPEQIIELRLVECGLDAKGISVRYQDYLQSIEIVIGPSAGATSDHFPCIKEAAGYEIVTFEDGETFAAYTDFTSELARPEMLAMYEERLKESGLWEGFPERRDSDSLEAFARALEEHAGLEPGMTLRVSGDDILFDPPRDSSSYVAFAEKFSGLIAVVAYASIRDRLSLGIIGNGRFAE